jgi:hypothetical protein
MTLANKPSLKQFKFILVAVAIAGAMNLSFADDLRPGVPIGWTGSGALGEHFEIGIDPGESSEGHAAVYIAGKGVAKGKFAAMSQSIDVRAWQGKSAKFSMMAKVQEPGTHSEIWLRGTAGMAGNYNAISSTNIKSVKWEEASITMIIPKEITQLEFGVGLHQQGKLWVRDVTITPVATPPQAPRPKHEAIAEHIPLREPSAAPANLQFAE